MPPGVTRTLKLSPLSSGVRDCQQICYYQGREEAGGCYRAEHRCLAKQRPSLKGRSRQSRRNVLASELCRQCFTFLCSRTKRSGCVCRGRECSPCPGDSHGHHFAVELLFNTQLPLSQRNSFPRDSRVPKDSFPKDHYKSKFLEAIFLKTKKLP